MTMPFEETLGDGNAPGSVTHIWIKFVYYAKYTQNVKLEIMNIIYIIYKLVHILHIERNIWYLLW